MYTIIECSLRNFPGGHSGLNIHEQRGNPIVQLCEYFSDIFKRTSTALLVNISGGAKKNAIPEQCNITFAVPDTIASDLIRELNKDNLFNSCVGESHVKRPLCTARTIQNLEGLYPSAYSNNSSANALFAVSTTPYGPLEAEDSGLVVLSNNPAIITTEDGIITFTNFVRGVFAQDIQVTLDDITLNSKAANLQGSNEYQKPEDGWDASRDNPLIHVATEAFERIFSVKPTVGGVHAGLENRVIESRMGESFKSISIGPTMGGVHAAGEWVDIESVDRTYKALCEMLKIFSTMEEQ